MEKYDFTKHHFYGENHNHITKIIDILQAGNLEASFIRKFYAAVPMFNLSEEDYKIYSELAKNAFNLLQEHSNKPKVKVYQKNPKA